MPSAEMEARLAKPLLDIIDRLRGATNDYQVNKANVNGLISISIAVPVNRISHTQCSSIFNCYQLNE